MMTYRNGIGLLSRCSRRWLLNNIAAARDFETWCSLLFRLAFLRILENGILFEAIQAILAIQLFSNQRWMLLFLRARLLALCRSHLLVLKLSLPIDRFVFSLVHFCCIISIIRGTSDGRIRSKEWVGWQFSHFFDWKSVSHPHPADLLIGLLDPIIGQNEGLPKQHGYLNLALLLVLDNVRVYQRWRVSFLDFQGRAEVWRTLVLGQFKCRKRCSQLAMWLL